MSSLPALVIRVLFAVDSVCVCVCVCAFFIRWPVILPDFSGGGPQSGGCVMRIELCVCLFVSDVLRARGYLEVV